MVDKRRARGNAVVATVVTPAAAAAAAALSAVVGDWVEEDSGRVIGERDNRAVDLGNLPSK